MKWLSLNKKWSALIGVAIFLVLLNVTFLFYSPEQIVNFVGVENTYITLFLIATIGGVNSVTSGVLYSSLIAFAAGGADPLLLGVVTGFGIAIGDVLMFTLFLYGYRSIPENWQERVGQYSQQFTKLPQYLQYLLTFTYLAFSPFPNDILMFFLVTVRYRYRQIVPLVLFGGMTLATLFAYFGSSWWGG